MANGPLPIPTLGQIVQDQEFYRLPEANQLSILRDADADFAGLTPGAQRSIIQDFRRQHAPTAGERVQSGLEFVAPPAAATVTGVLAAPLGPGIAVPAAMSAASITRLGVEGLRPLLTDQPIRPGDEIARDVAVSGVEAGAGELLGRGGVAATERLLSPFAGRATPSMIEAQRQLQTVGKTLSAAQQTDAPLLHIIEGAVEASLFGGRRLADLKKAASEEGVARLAETLVQQAGTALPPSMVAKLITNSREIGLEAFSSAQRTLYREVDTAARGIIVDTTGVLGRVRAPQQNRFIDRAVAQADAGMDIKLEDLLTRPRAHVGPQGTTVTAITDTASFSAAQEARSRLLRVARRAKTAVTADDQAVGETAGRLASEIDRAMDAAASRLNPDALQKFRDANTFTREGMERFNNALVRSVVKKLEKEPGKLDDVLFQANSVDTWKKVRAAVDAGTYERLSQRMTTKLVETATDVNGVVRGETMLTRLQGLGPETVTAMFPKTADQLYDFARAAHAIQGAKGERFGRVAMLLTQAPAAIGAFTLQWTGTGAAILVGPAVVGRWLSNPAHIKTLVEGFRAGSKSQAFIRAMSQLALTSTSRVAGVSERIPVGATRAPTVIP